MIDLAQVLGSQSVKVPELERGRPQDGALVFSDTIFSLDGLDISARDLVARFPKLEELGDN